MFALLFISYLMAIYEVSFPIGEILKFNSARLFRLFGEFKHAAH